MLKRIRDIAALWKAAGQYDEIRKEADSMDSKHLFLSKTFWMNVLGLAITVGGLLPAKWAGPVLAVANIGMRLVTNQPVNLFPPQPSQ